MKGRAKWKKERRKSVGNEHKPNIEQWRRSFILGDPKWKPDEVGCPVGIKQTL